MKGKLFLFLLLGIFLTSNLLALMPTPIQVNNSELIITKYDGVEAQTYLPQTDGNQLCLYHKANTNATSLEELKQLIQEAQDNVPEWDIGISYNVGDLVSYQDQIYKVLQSHSSQSAWTPDVVPALFVEYAFQDIGEVPQWTQPTGGHDAYNLGDRVWFENGDKLIYESLINANVWSPTAYPAGWKEIGIISETEVYGDENIEAINELGNSVIVPRDLEEGVSTYCVNVTKKIQIGTNTIIAELFEDVDYLYETASFEYEGFEIDFYCNGEKLDFPTASIIAEDEIGIGVKWSLKVPENYSCIGEFTAQQNILEKINTKESLFIAEQEKYFIDYSDFEGSPLNNITSYEVTEVKDMDLSTWQQFVLFFKKIFGYEPTEEEYLVTIAYNKTWTGEFYDFDPSYSYTVVTSDVTMVENVTSEPEFSHLNITDTSLVGYWSFDENARDLTNNNYDGTLLRDAFINKSAGQYGGGLQLGGAEDYVNVGDKPYLSFTDGAGNDKPFTISAWVNPKSTDIILSKMAGGGYFEYILSTKTLALYDSSDGASQIKTSLDIALSNSGEWQYITVTYNGNESADGLNYYVNGVLPAQTRSSGGTYVGMSNTISEFRIGTKQYSPTYFNGSIDEVMIFNRALNSTEIQEIYNSTYSRFYPEGNQTFQFENITEGYNRVNLTADAETLNGSSLNATIWEANVDANSGYIDNNTGLNDSGLVAYYHADGNYLDYSGNGNNGTIVGEVYTNGTGVFNSSFSFDGDGDYITVGGGVVNSNIGTIGTWIKSEGNIDGTYIISSRASGEGNTRNYIRTDSGENILISLGDVLDRDLGKDFSGNWDYLSIEWNTGNANVYLNGVLEDTFTYTDFTSTLETKIAGYALTGGGSFNGQIDEVMIFNRSLSAEEIKSLYITGSTDHRNDGVGVNWSTTEGEKNLPLENVSTYDYAGSCDEGLVSAWTASDNGFNDECGLNNGTASGDATIVERTDHPLLNGTYSFDGNEDYIEMSSSTLDDPTSFTINTWVRGLHTPSVSERILESRDISAPNNGISLFSSSTTGLIGTILDTSAGVGNIYSTTSLLDNSWHFVSWKWDGTKQYIYIDGVEEDSADIGGSISKNVVFRIAQGTQYSAYFNGQIDEVSIWNKSLTSTEILELYYAGTEKHKNEYEINPLVNLIMPEFSMNSGDDFFYSPILKSFTLETWNATGGEPPASNTAPSVVITNPSTNDDVYSTYNITWIALDPQLDTLLQNITLTNSTGTYDIAINLVDSINSYLWDTTTYADGDYNLTLTVCENATADLFCSNNTKEIMINQIPVITIEHPINGSTYTESSLDINYSILVPSQIDSCWYSLDYGITNSTPKEYSTVTATATVIDGCDPGSEICTSTCGDVLNTDLYPTSWAYDASRDSCRGVGYVIQPREILTDAECDAVLGSGDGTCSHYDNGLDYYCPSAVRQGSAVVATDCTCVGLFCSASPTTAVFNYTSDYFTITTAPVVEDNNFTSVTYPEGNVTTTVYCNNTFGNTGFSSNDITVDLPASINSITPENGSYQNVVYLFSINATDTQGVAEINYSMDGGANTTYTSQFNMYAPAGVHNYTIWVTDTYGSISTNTTAFNTLGVLNHTDVCSSDEDLKGFYENGSAICTAKISSNRTILISLTDEEYYKDANISLHSIVSYINDSRANNLSCNVKVDYPNQTTLINRTLMSFLDNGIYEYNISSTNVIGYYYSTVDCYDEYLQASSFSFKVNSTLTQGVLDANKPIISLLSPINGTLDSDGGVEFIFNVTDASTIGSCELFVNNVLKYTLTTVVNNSNNSISYSGLSDQTKNWTVNCTDNQGNEGNSSVWDLAVASTPPDNPQGGSGGYTPITGTGGYNKSLVCDYTNAFLVDKLTKEGFSYKYEDILNLTNIFNLDNEPKVTISLFELFITNFETQCNRSYPSKNKTESPMIGLVGNDSECSKDLEKIFTLLWVGFDLDTSMPFFEIDLGKESCESLKNKRLWFELSELGDDYYSITGFKLWWIILIYIAISSAVIYKIDKKDKKKWSWILGVGALFLILTMTNLIGVSNLGSSCSSELSRKIELFGTKLNLDWRLPLPEIGIGKMSCSGLDFLKWIFSIEDLSEGYYAINGIKIWWLYLVGSIFGFIYYKKKKNDKKN